MKALRIVVVLEFKGIADADGVNVRGKLRVDRRCFCGG